MPTWMNTSVCSSPLWQLSVSILTVVVFTCQIYKAGFWADRAWTEGIGLVLVKKTKQMNKRILFQNLVSLIQCFNNTATHTV